MAETETEGAQEEAEPEGTLETMLEASPGGQDTPLIHQSHVVIVIIDTDPELGTV